MDETTITHRESLASIVTTAMKIKQAKKKTPVDFLPYVVGVRGLGKCVRTSTLEQCFSMDPLYATYSLRAKDPLQDRRAIERHI